MLPLNDRQVELFVERSGLSDGDAFLEEVERQNAWTFARRPLDLSELIVAWRESGFVGSQRTQQHEENVAVKLKEGPDRPDSGILADTKARCGAERLALALTLPEDAVSDPRTKLRHSIRRPTHLMPVNSLPTGL